MGPRRPVARSVRSLHSRQVRALFPPACTQAGKTTALNALAGAIPARERVISCEEVFELRLAARDWVAMQCRQPNLEGTGEIPLRRLVKEALRMRLARLLVGEVQEAEALDLLLALNAGIPGVAVDASGRVTCHEAGRACRG